MRSQTLPRLRRCWRQSSKERQIRGVKYAKNAQEVVDRIVAHRSKALPEIIWENPGACTLMTFASSNSSHSLFAQETMGGHAKRSAFYTRELAEVLMECWYPKQWHGTVPGLVTLNLPKSVWLKDERGVAAVKQEAVGLRTNGAWDDDSVQLVSTPSRVKPDG